MIKRIIFDLDNTLIFWEDEYWTSLNKVFERINYPVNQEIISKLCMAVDDYENCYSIYKNEYMLEIMSKYANIDLPDIFINYWLEELSECVKPLPNEVIDTLEYLHKKYDLVVLTNWFASSQIERLKKVNIFKYFTEIFCADSFPIKPNPESYLIASKGYDLSECLMIGDGLVNDVIGPTKLGMKAIYYDYKDNYHDDEYQTIKRFEDLKKIL